MTQTNDAGNGGAGPTRRIPASVAESAMEHVTSFYDATPASIFHELYQNARRAGATVMNVTIDPSARTVTVTDDGNGVRRPEALLSFGESDWNDAASRDEHPAGMELYSLSRRGCVIRSRNSGDAHGAWRAVLEPEHFQGRRAAVIDTDPTAGPTGTTVTFPYYAYESGLKYRAREQAQHLPLRVLVNGVAVEQNPFFNPATTVGVGEDDGLVFCVHRIQGWMDYPQSSQLRINFHGHVVDDETATPVVRGLDAWWTAEIDVKRCPKLELVLPGRERVIQNEYLRQVVERMETAIYEVIARQRSPQPLLFEYAERAKEFGCEIKTTRERLFEWKMRPADPDWHGRPEMRLGTAGADAIIVSRDLTSSQQGMIDRALTCEEKDMEGAGTEPGDTTRGRLFADTGALEGFEWYDRMPKISDVGVEIEVDGKRSTIDPMDDTNRAADRLWVVLAVRRGDEIVETIRLESDMALSARWEANYPSACGLILNRSRTEDLSGVEYAVDRAIFVKDKGDSNGRETQNKPFNADLEIETRKLLDGPSAGLDAALQAALTGMPAVPAGTTVHMASVDGRSWNIETHLPETPSDPVRTERHRQRSEGAGGQHKHSERPGKPAENSRETDQGEKVGGRKKRAA